MNTLIKIGVLLMIIGFIGGLLFPFLYVVGVIGLVLEGIGLIIMFFNF